MNAGDTCAFLSKAYVKKSVVFEWRKWFKESHRTVEEDERSGCPGSHRTSETVDKVWNLVHSDRHLSFRAMAVQLNFDKETQILRYGFGKDGSMTFD